MVSVLVVYVFVADDGLQGLLEGADRLRISQTAPSRSSDQLMNVADTPSTLARALDPLGGRESCLHGLAPLFAIAQHKGEIVQVTYQLLPWISNVISLPLRYDSLSIKCWSRWSKTPPLQWRAGVF